MERLVVILAYAFALVVILFPPRALRAEEPVAPPWWRNVRVWAAFIIAVQIAVYAVLG